MGKEALGRIQSQILWNRLLAVVEEYGSLTEHWRNWISPRAMPSRFWSGKGRLQSRRL